MSKRVAFIFTHRIQYFTNLLDELRKRGVIEPLAIYARETSQIDDPGFGRRIDWDNRPQINCREIILDGRKSVRLGSFRFGLSRALALFQPDIVHLNGYGDVIQWQAWAWAKSHRVPIFIRGDGDTLGKRASQLQRFKRKAATIFTRQARIVFYQGEENRKFWIDNGASEDRLCWIPCVSDNDVFQKPAFISRDERLKFRQIHGAGNEDVVFLVSGKLIERKRPADVIRALSQLAETKTRLWFLGSGPFEDNLKRLAAEIGISDRVTFLGFRNQTEMPAILQAADVLIHPSESDPWPYAALEAAHSGLALQLSDKTGSYPDWIETNHAGAVFHCGDIDSLATAMKVCVAEPEKLKRWKDAARNAARNYTEAEFCEIFEDKVAETVRA